MSEQMNVPIDDIKRIVSYLIDAERAHWESRGEPDDHIFHSFAAVQEWLTRSAPNRAA